ncbi:MAG: DUF4326 domain-containing protein [Acaryochloris sp. RU_4_1]|nr:DUF4326 domain-containing protein [Acaryochloris sp. RU_4_1]NJR56966.1 DUF4326 domain-containing protein [Acaryochloris sp. CRU_2_0]
MPTIHIANLRKSRHQLPGVRCDGLRPAFGHRGTPLGNPFHMFDESERDLCIAAFDEFLHEVTDQGAEPSKELIHQIAQKHKVMPNSNYKSFCRDEIMATLEVLGHKSEVTLLCWCHPKPCHCQVLKAYLESQSPAPEQLSLEVP